jgi:hypothetical protein
MFFLREAFYVFIYSLMLVAGVVACVEVRSKNENRSVAVSHELRKMGAQVVDKLTPEVTHVIWKEGKPSTRDRAKKRGIPVISVLWVASCKQNKERVPECLFGVSDTSAKNTPVVVGKLKVNEDYADMTFVHVYLKSMPFGQPQLWLMVARIHIFVAPGYH